MGNIINGDLASVKSSVQFVMAIDASGNSINSFGTTGTTVNSVNGLMGSINIVGGTGIAISTASQTITINSSGGTSSLTTPSTTVNNTISTFSGTTGMGLLDTSLSATGTTLFTAANDLNLRGANNINLQPVIGDIGIGSDAIPLQSGTYSLGSAANPFLNIYAENLISTGTGYLPLTGGALTGGLSGTSASFTSITGTTIFQGSNQVLNTVTGLGNISVTSTTNGFVTISGAATAFPTFVASLGVGQLTGTNASFAALTGTILNFNAATGVIANVTTQSGTTLVYTNVTGTNISGTVINAQTINTVNLTGTNISGTTVNVNNLTVVGSVAAGSSGTVNVASLGTPLNNVYVNNIFVSGLSIGQRLIANIQVVSGTTVAFSGLTTGQRYKAEYNLNWGSAGGHLNTIFNNDTGAFYNYSTFVFSNGGSASRTGGSVANIPLTDPSVNITTPGQANGNFTFQSQPGSGVNASIFGEATANTGAGASSCQGVVCNGTYFGTANITSMALVPSAGNFTGQVLLYALP